jgi:hypothetical protein
MRAIALVRLCLGVMFVVGCSPPPQGVERVRKVTVAFAGVGCESDCPFEGISIDDSLKLSFFGGSSSKRPGFFAGRISKVLWDSVAYRFQEFLLHGPATPDRRTDHPGVEFLIEGDSTLNRFQGNMGFMTRKDIETMYWFRGLVDRADELQRKDTLVFGTTYQDASAWPWSAEH